MQGFAYRMMRLRCKINGCFLISSISTCASLAATIAVKLAIEPPDTKTPPAGLIS